MSLVRISSAFSGAVAYASKASLASLESVGSYSRHPWNDSGINLPDDETGILQLNVYWTSVTPWSCLSWTLYPRLYSQLFGGALPLMAITLSEIPTKHSAPFDL